MRSKQVDRYMDDRFGKPDFTQTFLDTDPNSPTYNKWLTPFPHVRLWRVDMEKLKSDCHPK